MIFQTLQDAAVHKVDALLGSGDAAKKEIERRKLQKQLLDKVRKHLWTLTCQADVVEMTGVLDDFGGEKDVEGNISKAIFGLLCIGTVFGVNVPQRLEKLIADLSGTPGGAAAATDQTKQLPTEEKKADADAPATGTDNTADAAAPGEGVDKGGTDGTAPPAEGESSSGSIKEQKVKSHEQNLRAAKTTADLDRVWKHDITPDKDLEGKDKAPLYTVYKECRKKFTQK